MKISELQSLMSMNRKSIKSLEDECKVYLKLRNYHDAVGNTLKAYNLHDKLQKTKKKIVKLVSLQKSLKREIKAKVEMESERNRLNRYYTSLHANYGAL